MALRPLLLLLLAAPSAAATSAPRLRLSGVLVRPALSAPPPALSAPRAARATIRSAAFGLPALPAAAAAAARRPKDEAAAKPASAALPGLPAAVPIPAFIPGVEHAVERALEEQTQAGRVRFDQAAAKPEPPAVDAGPSPVYSSAQGWELESFRGDGGLEIFYRRRPGDEKFEGLRPRVFAGGLALNDSFATLLAGRSASRPEYVLSTRGHAPTGWAPTAHPLDADARDLARLLALAAGTSRSRRVELVLHSFGTLVFQRMLQLRGDPLVDKGLEAVSESKVVFLNGTTRYQGSELRAGAPYALTGQLARGSVDWLDSSDAAAELAASAAQLNPFAAPAAEAWLARYRALRAQSVAMATRGAAAATRRDLQARWSPRLEPQRQLFLERLEREADDAGWQEALLRRSADMFRLDMTQEDVKHLRRLSVDLHIVHGRDDDMINWESARALLELFGLPSPAQAPEPGTILSRGGNRFKAHIVDGDHYWPLKQPDALGRFLGL